MNNQSNPERVDPFHDSGRAEPPNGAANDDWHLFYMVTNDGAEIVDTNYWQTEQAQHGLCFLTANAGTWRLLVPPKTEYAIPEMRTGRRVTIENSLLEPQRCWDIVFQDGTDAPFSVTLDRQLVDRPLKPGKCQLTVWAEHGKVLTFPCTVKCSSRCG